MPKHANSLYIDIQISFVHLSTRQALTVTRAMRYVQIKYRSAIKDVIL